MKQKITQNLGIVFFIFFSLSALAQDLAINEVMASNDNIIADADGDYEDWIEIYNYGTTPINLDGLVCLMITQIFFNGRFLLM